MSTIRKGGHRSLKALERHLLSAHATVISPSFNPERLRELEMEHTGQHAAIHRNQTAAAIAALRGGQAEQI